MTLAAGQVVAQLKTNLLAATQTVAGSKVYTDRAWPVDESELPTLQVFAGEESITPVVVHWPALQEHRLELLLVGKVSAVSGIDETMNVFIAQILTKLYGTANASTLYPLTGVRLEPPGERTVIRTPQEDAQAKFAHFTVRAIACFQTMSNAPETLV
jgi:hypothetical protein